MSDQEMDFVIIDSSQVESSQRQRKPKYKTKPWEYSDTKGEYEYYKIVQRNYRRRHGITETPYDHLVDPIMEREEEYAKLFPITLIELRLMAEEKGSKNESR